jgi:single-strand DNA-binding protein
MNKVFLVGRLTADPILKTTTNSTQIANITVATQDNRNRAESYFFPCIAWQATATYVNSYLKKGDLVSIDGRLTRRSYTSKDGKMVSVTEVVIESINSLGKTNRTEETFKTMPVENSFNQTVAQSKSESKNDEAIE